MVEAPLKLRPLTETDRPWVRQVMLDNWGDTVMLVHGDVFDLILFPGFVAEIGVEKVGVVTYDLRGAECEILSLNSLKEGLGIGAALINAVCEIARSNSVRRLFLNTTNDNINALRFYQKRGFELAAIRRHAVDDARKIKPGIPLVGDFGIPIRDEIEMEMLL